MWYVASGCQSAVKVRNREHFSKEAYEFIDTLKEAGAALLADSAIGTDQLRRLALPVIFGLLQAIPIHRSRQAGGGRSPYRRGM